MTINKFSNSVALLISIYFLPEPGGGATAAMNRAKLLQNIGYKVYVLCGFPTYPSGKLSDPKYANKFFYVEKIDQLTIIRLRLLMLKHEGYLKRLFIFVNFILASLMFLPKIIKVTGTIDVVYSLAPIFFSSVIGFIYSKTLKAFFIYDVPDLWPEELIAFKTHFSPIILFIGKIMSKIMYSSPDIIITISDSAAAIIQRNYHPKTPIYTVPIGVDPTMFRYLEKNDCRNKLIKDQIYPVELSNKVLIVYTGLVSRAQKVQNLLKVAKRIGDPDIKFLIVGNGEDIVNVKAESEKLSNVYVIPYQSRDVIPYIIHSADICSVLLSPEPIFEIAFPTKFYEYLACKKPIIGVCKGELADIINKYNLGLATSEDDLDLLVSYIMKVKDSNWDRNMENNFNIALKEFSIKNLSVRLESILHEEFQRKR